MHITLYSIPLLSLLNESLNTLKSLLNLQMLANQSQLLLPITALTPRLLRLLLQRLDPLHYHALLFLIAQRVLNWKLHAQHLLKGADFGVSLLWAGGVGFESFLAVVAGWADAFGVEWTWVGGSFCRRTYFLVKWDSCLIFVLSCSCVFTLIYLRSTIWQMHHQFLCQLWLISLLHNFSLYLLWLLTVVLLFPHFIHLLEPSPQIFNGQFSPIGSLFLARLQLRPVLPSEIIHFVVQLHFEFIVPLEIMQVIIKQAFVIFQITWFLDSQLFLQDLVFLIEGIVLVLQAHSGLSSGHC